MGMAERESKPDFMNTDNAYVNRAEDLLEALGFRSWRRSFWHESL